MRVLWLVGASSSAHTVQMKVEPRAKTFVTGASGFIGTALVKILAAAGHEVLGLARSVEGARRVRRAGGIVVMGDLLAPGPWQDQVSADWVFHLAPRLDCERHQSRRRAALTRARVRMDAHLLDALATGPTRRIVYVADANWYGATGSRPITEDEPPSASALERCFMPVLDRLDGYVIAGFPIVSAFPAWVYGNGAWLRRRVVEPVMRGSHVLQCGNAEALVSPIHVDDCARALAHLAEHGHAGGRYFLSNNDAVRLSEFATTFARLADRPLRVLRVRKGASLLLHGRFVSDCLHSDAVFSNIRLRGIGFRFRYPTVEDGLQQVLGALHEQ